MMIKKVIRNLDSSKASDPDFIPEVVPKNSELELSYILVECFNRCLKESCFPDCWKVSVVSKVFEKLVNDSLVEHLEKCGLFFQISSMLLGLIDQPQIF